MLNIICFSPTGTTKALALAVAEGLGGGARLTDLTSPEAASQPPPALSRSDVLIAAVPVYMGRVPEIARARLAAVRADGTPAVCLVAYGNREYEDALLELRVLMTSCGCTVVAGAACVAEHSFSSPDAPIAEGRPDADDLARTAAFGKAVREKLHNPPGGSGALPAPDFPGVTPYKRSSEIWDVDFINVDARCTGCMRCAEVCPAGAIAPDAPERVDIAKCVTCCACVKACPAGARTMKEGRVMDARNRLRSLCAARKEPEFFL